MEKEETRNNNAKFSGHYVRPRTHNVQRTHSLAPILHINDVGREYNATFLHFSLGFYNGMPVHQPAKRGDTIRRMLQIKKLYLQNTGLYLQFKRCQEKNKQGEELARISLTNSWEDFARVYKKKQWD